MHRTNSNPFSIPLSVITLQLLVLYFSTILAQSSTKAGSGDVPILKLTTVAPFPTTWTASANCLTQTTAHDDNGNVIYNIGCGVTYRKTCCPPNWKLGAIFGDATSTIGGSRGVCPSGYTGKPMWGGRTDGPVLTARGETTVICCPSVLSLWSLFGLSQSPLCFTQNPATRANTQVPDPVYVSTYARPFIFAVEAVVTATSSATSSSTSSATSSTTSSATSSATSSVPSSTTETTSGRPTTGSVSTGVETTTSKGAPTETGGAGRDDSGANPGGVNNGGDTVQGEKKSGLSPGAIAGIVIGVGALIIIGIIAFIFWRRRSHDLDEGMDPPIPPPAQNSSDKYIPLDDSRSSSYGNMETGAYQYKLPAGSETILGSNVVGMRNGENEERRVGVFENAEKSPEQNENMAVYGQRNHKFGRVGVEHRYAGPARAK